MFGFVRPAACRSSAPRSVTDGRPYPPLPRRAKKQKQDSTVFSQKTGNQRKWWERLPPSADSFHRPRGGPPPSMREVWGFAGQGLRPCRRLHIGALRSPLSPFARPLEDSYTTPGAGHTKKISAQHPSPPLRRINQPFQRVDAAYALVIGRRIVVKRQNQFGV